MIKLAKQTAENLKVLLLYISRDFLVEHLQSFETIIGGAKHADMYTCIHMVSSYFKPHKKVRVRRARQDGIKLARGAESVSKDDIKRMEDTVRASAMIFDLLFYHEKLSVLFLHWESFVFMT